MTLDIVNPLDNSYDKEYTTHLNKWQVKEHTHFFFCKVLDENNWQRNENVLQSPRFVALNTLSKRH